MKSLSQKYTLTQHIEGWQIRNGRGPDPNSAVGGYANTMCWWLYINSVSVGSLWKQPLVESPIKELPEVWSF
jgi:hypothetical protein